MLIKVFQRRCQKDCHKAASEATVIQAQSAMERHYSGYHTGVKHTRQDAIEAAETSGDWDQRTSKAKAYHNRLRAERKGAERRCQGIAEHNGQHIAYMGAAGCYGQQTYNGAGRRPRHGCACQRIISGGKQAEHTNVDQRDWDTYQGRIITPAAGGAEYSGIPFE